MWLHTNTNYRARLHSLTHAPALAHSLSNSFDVTYAPSPTLYHGTAVSSNALDFLSKVDLQNYATLCSMFQKHNSGT